MDIQIGIIPGGRAGSMYKRRDNITIVDGASTDDVVDLMSDAMCLCNDEDDVARILDDVKAGEVVVEWDSFGEGVVVYAPVGTRDDTMELKAYRMYNE